MTELRAEPPGGSLGGWVRGDGPPRSTASCDTDAVAPSADLTPRGRRQLLALQRAASLIDVEMLVVDAAWR